MGRPAGHFLSTLMKAEILHPACFFVKHFSEKKDAQVVPQFHPREIGPHFQF